ncbi:MAG: copper amine oxidase N-terminal domain-containing protein [Clostridiales bacterium]|jgi:hypothetical protein|nr:copper amine oxidase N-terminal domain-containing protein [Clostridiales bacterium]
MKKLKVLVALLAVASMVLSSAAFVYADEAVVTDAPLVAAPAEEAAPAKVYDDLATTERDFFNAKNYVLGAYPVITDYDALSAKIKDDLETKYLLARDLPSSGSANSFNVSYVVTNEGQYAVIEVTYNYNYTTIKTEPFAESNKYYIDKEAAAEITEEEYTKAKEAAEEEAAPGEEEEAPAVDETPKEIVKVPLRKYAEDLGYNVGWNGELQLISILSGANVITTISIGKNEYSVGDAIVPLESAPELQDGVTYVPVSFFEKVLGAVYSVGTDGEISISPAE